MIAGELLPQDQQSWWYCINTHNLAQEMEEIHKEETFSYSLLCKGRIYNCKHGKCPDITIWCFGWPRPGRWQIFVNNWKQMGKAEGTAMHLHLKMSFPSVCLLSSNSYRVTHMETQPVWLFPQVKPHFCNGIHFPIYLPHLSILHVKKYQIKNLIIWHKGKWHMTQPPHIMPSERGWCLVTLWAMHLIT